MKTTYTTGIQGEETAAEYLTRKFGMVLLEHRYRTRAGEIDLILEDGDAVVFAEVKTRKTGDPGNGLSAVNNAKQKRIAQGAVIYLIQKGWTRRTVRFDLVEICGGEILYIPNAFQQYGKLRV